MSSVIREDRERGAALVARWLDSNITNWEFDDAWPWESPDLAVIDIGRELWCHFDDVPEFKLEFSDLTEAERALIDRCMLFLKCEEPYDPVKYIEPRKGIIARLFRVNPLPETMEMLVDDERKKWWPFANEAQYRKALDQR